MKQQRIVLALISLAIVFLAGGFGLVTAVQSQDSPPAEPPPAAMEPLAAQANSILFSYQGRLLDKSGKPLNSSGLPMVFEIFPQLNGGSSCWKESHSGGNAVKVQDGVFQVTLGQLKAISAACATWEAYLQLTINGETLAPRERLTSVATALKSVTADSAIIASTTAGLSDGATANGDLLVKGNILAAPGNGNMYVRNPAGNSNLRFAAGGNIHIFIDSNNDSSSRVFTLSTDNDSLAPPLKHLLVVEESGRTTIKGNLVLESGTCTQTALGADSSSTTENCSGGNLTTAAVIEANLQTADELNSDRIERFSEGDVLCWAGEQLEKCAKENDRLVQAVASVEGRPIVIGAEPIRVIGPVEMGDILVSSAVPGYAMVNNDPAPGTVIAQALEDLEGESGFIKAMIRKW